MFANLTFFLFLALLEFKWDKDVSEFSNIMADMNILLKGKKDIISNLDCQVKLLVR